MVDVYSTEPERVKALEELTALRRELKTETASGARAAAKDPRFIAAKERLDAAKKAAGMRTSAQDLAALNRLSAGKKTAKQVTEVLNARTMQYGAQLQEAYKNPDKVPTWSGRTRFGRKFTPEDIQFARQYDLDLRNARLDWVWYEPKDDAGNPIEGEASWRLGVIGAKTIPKDRSGYLSDADYATDLFAGDRINLGEWAKTGMGARVPAMVQFTKGKPTEREQYLLDQAKGQFYTAYNPFRGMLDTQKIVELTQALPELKYTEIQEILYRLTLEKDTDITIEDILDKHDELYGEG